jgi:hypothetical protein
MAWDNRKDESRLFDGLNALVHHGVKLGEILVYMLIGYWPGETHDDREDRRRRLREFGALPFPLSYTRTRELVGYQRWVRAARRLDGPWDEYRSANCRPERLQRPVDHPAVSDRARRGMRRRCRLLPSTGPASTG